MRSERLFGSPAGSRAPAALGMRPVAAARRCPRSGSGHEMAPCRHRAVTGAAAAYSRCGIPRPARSPRRWCCRRRSLPGASVPPPQSLRSGSLAGRVARGTHRDDHHPVANTRLVQIAWAERAAVSGWGHAAPGACRGGRGRQPRRRVARRSQAVTSARPGPAAQFVGRPGCAGARPAGRPPVPD